MTSSRLSAPFGRLIDQEKARSFNFEGKDVSGFAGDTVGSALHANGIKTVSRSFKYHRPRGFLSFSGFDANGYIQVGDVPNVLSDSSPLVEQMPPSNGQNSWGQIEKDRDAWLGFAKRFLPVGFYYRSFFGPLSPWQLYEKIFRAKAGLGKVNKSGRHAQADKINLHTDVAVVGGGYAGLYAALTAAEDGAEVSLVEMMPQLGGSALFDEDSKFEKVQALVSKVLAHPRISLLQNAFAQGLYDDNLLSVETESKYIKLRAVSVVLATGSYEQPIIFRGNDLPGVMLSSAARRLLWLYGVKPGKIAVVATVNDHGLETALQLSRAGVEISAVADLRSQPNSLHTELEKLGAEIYMSSAPYEALGPRSKTSAYFGGPVEAVRLCRYSSRGEPNPFRNAIDCDLVIMSGGYVPAAGLACHAGGKLAYDPKLDSLALDGTRDGVYFAGQIDHFYGDEAVRLSAENAGKLAAAFVAGEEIEETLSQPNRSDDVNHPYPIVPHPEGDEFVDLDEDLTIKDIKNAIADGFTHGELLKRYSTAGMGPSQGRFAALNVLRIAARQNQLAPDEMGTTTVRPPLRAERFTHLAGPHQHPTARTPLQNFHEDNGAVLMPSGNWLRPAYYGKQEDKGQAIAREVEAVRSVAGVIDVSTLGKIEVCGPDASEFLDRVFLTSHSKQKVGRARYAVRCGSDGSIVDDGVICRLTDTSYYVTTTSGQATPAYRHMTWLQSQWQMDISITNVTSSYAAINLAGPSARDIISQLQSDIDFASEPFPYMATAVGNLSGVPVRIARVGFVGELGYEIHVPALYAQGLWDLLLQVGASYDIKPFGVLAQRLLRLEKGHVIVGQDTDGLTTPAEANMAWAVPKSKKSYWGRAGLATRAKRPLDRLLVGFRITDEEASVPPECTLIIEGEDIVGRVTSAEKSDRCGGIIGLCFIHPDRAQDGESFNIKLPDGKFVAAKIVSPPFYDAGNERQGV